MLETALFYLFSTGAVIFALGVILSRSAVYSVLNLVGTMAMTAGLFILLKAYFVSVVLILVYAGAILVLFLFVVMMVDFRKLSEGWQGFKVPWFFALLLSGGFLAEVVWLLRSVRATSGASQILEPAQGTAQNIGRVLFSNYLLPFELTSFLLLAAVVSVVVLAKKEPAK